MDACSDLSAVVKLNAATLATYSGSEASNSSWSPIRETDYSALTLELDRDRENFFAEAMRVSHYNSPSGRARRR